MRHLGTLDTEAKARRFHDYLLSQKIASRVDPADGVWDLWVIEEDDVPRARAALEEFRNDPSSPELEKQVAQGQALRVARQKQALEAVRRRLEVRRRPAILGAGHLPITFFLITISVVVTLMITLDNNDYGLITDFTIASFEPAGNDRIRFYTDLREIRGGEIWRLVTPIFVHYDAFHLLFNMYWTYIFGAMLEPRLRSWRFLVMVLFLAVFSNLAEFYVKIPPLVFDKDPTFGGMSGVDFGLFGFIWIKGRLEPRLGIGLPDLTVYLMLGFLFLCLTGIFGPIANTAHFAGFLLGCGLAAMRPLTRRRPAR
ncbi:rhomboid family intramembrane serine protease [Rubinisphaera margarita]|uniref:rhomboid family intramembrane serine protease n=1 Tax=Rubinisphaera margarita TaxID=2909586 RepID=UPI001EE98946|nr:rhomboid family intramembrane serine protease [Rubinisphaera margarita]MCG6154455.1 rhomboid family intramembrane serine protease [Rubinisphaera margarita]